MDERPSPDEDDRIDLLTTQVLRLLERLAEARRRAGDLEERLREVEEEREALRRGLEDARGRVRRSRSEAPLGPARGAAAVEVVVCGAGEEAAATARAFFAAGEAVTWVSPPDPGGEAVCAPEEVRRLTADWPRRPHLWNIAVAASEAGLLLFVEPGTRPAEGGDARCAFDLSPFDDDAVAAVRLALRDASGAVTTGRRAEAWLLGDHPDGGDDALLLPDARAFCLRKAAFERVGPFDEDLVGGAALLDWALRASDLGYRFPAADLPLLAPGQQEEDETALADRLLVIAKHRPSGFVDALEAARRTLDRVGVPARAAWLEAAVRRVRERLEDVEAWDVLLAVARRLAAECVPASEMAALREEHERTRTVLEEDRAAQRRRAEELEQELAAQRKRAEELERAAAVQRDRTARFEGEAAEQRRRNEELHEEIARVRERLRAAEEGATALRRELEAAAERAEARVREVRCRLAAAAGLPEHASTEQIAAEVAAQRARLAELLREVSGGLFGRRLRPEERRFLSDGGGDG